MWPKNYTVRLQEWVALRDRISSESDVATALASINSWWFRTPWCPFHIHWDDHKEWPNPWELLSDNIYCELARGLGIMYTIMMIDRNDIVDPCLVQTDEYNLVLIDDGKYILNWSADEILNIDSQPLNIKKVLHPTDLSHLLG